MGEVKGEDDTKKAVVIGDRVRALIAMSHWKPKPLQIGDMGTIISYKPGRRNGDTRYGPYKIEFCDVTGWLDVDDFEKARDEAKQEALKEISDEPKEAPKETV